MREEINLIHHQLNRPPSWYRWVFWDNQTDIYMVIIYAMREEINLIHHPLNRPPSWYRCMFWDNQTDIYMVIIYAMREEINLIHHPLNRPPSWYRWVFWDNQTDIYMVIIYAMREEINLIHHPLNRPPSWYRWVVWETVDSKMFARTFFSLIFANSFPREFKVLANIGLPESKLHWLWKTFENGLWWTMDWKFNFLTKFIHKPVTV